MLEIERAVIRDGIVLGCSVISSSFDPWQRISVSSQSQILWLQISDNTLEIRFTTRTHLKHQSRFYLYHHISKYLTPEGSLFDGSSSWQGLHQSQLSMLGQTTLEHLALDWPQCPVSALTRPHVSSRGGCELSLFPGCRRAPHFILTTQYTYWQLNFIQHLNIIRIRLPPRMIKLTPWVLWLQKQLSKKPIVHSPSSLALLSTLFGSF